MQPKPLTIPLIGGPGDGMAFEFLDLQPGQRPPSMICIPYQGQDVVDWVQDISKATDSGYRVAYYHLGRRVDALVEKHEEVCRLEASAYIWHGLGERYGGEKTQPPKRRRRKP